MVENECASSALEAAVATGPVARCADDDDIAVHRHSGAEGIVVRNICNAQGLLRCPRAVCAPVDPSALADLDRTKAGTAAPRSNHEPVAVCGDLRDSRHCLEVWVYETIGLREVAGICRCGSGHQSRDE